MRRVVSLVSLSLLSMAWLALVPGCAMDAQEGSEDELVAAEPDEALDESAPEPVAEDELAAIPVEEDDASAEAEALASKGDGVESQARENGDWCHAKCSFADIVYAGPNVTRNCHDWGHIVCHNRSSELVNAYWCAPLQCRIDAILQ
jgi:hypothetical protein